MTDATPTLWRVGYHRDPLAFAPRELYHYGHRFDDAHQRFRTLYCAEDPRTCLREVLADLRPNAAARQRFLQAFGEDAADELVAEPVTTRWREQHVLVELHLEIEGEMIDLADVRVRHELEERHALLLAEHDLEHLDVHQITTRRRIVTQTIAADLYDRGAAAVRFPSQLDGQPCVALLEGRGTPRAAGAPVSLGDPAPPALIDVCKDWGLRLAPTRAVTSRPGTDPRPGG